MILLRKILVATDFSQPSDAALRYGRALAQRFDATLFVLHVADVVTTGIGAEGGRFDDAQRDAEEAARLRIDALLTEEDRRALGARAVAIASILPAEKIAGYAKLADVDVIVLGTHGRSGVAHMLVGSVAEEVVRTAPCPVLTVKHSEHDFVLPDLPRDANRTTPDLMIALNRILVPSDFSETSEAAVRYGVALARTFHATLYVLHVEPRHDLETMVEGELVAEKSLRDTGAVNVPQNAARELLGKILTEQEQTDVPAEYVLRASGLGGPSVEIVRYAQERDIDLIVLGTHGRSGVAHMLVGSVAEKVVRTAPCPVLTVRHPEHEFVMPDAAANKVPLAAGTPAKNDICLRQKSDGAWSVFQGEDERLPPMAGLHLTDRERAEEVGQDIASCEKVDLWVYEHGCYVRMERRHAAEPGMSCTFEWRSLTTVHYGRSEGSAVLNFVAETGRFEYCLPGALLRVFDATSFDELHRLKDHIEATLASAHDIRGCVAFIDRHATPSH